MNLNKQVLGLLDKRNHSNSYSEELLARNNDGTDTQALDAEAFVDDYFGDDDNDDDNEGDDDIDDEDEDEDEAEDEDDEELDEGFRVDSKYNINDIRESAFENTEENANLVINSDVTNTGSTLRKSMEIPPDNFDDDDETTSDSSTSSSSSAPISLESVPVFTKDFVLSEDELNQDKVNEVQMNTVDRTGAKSKRPLLSLFLTTNDSLSDSQSSSVSPSTNFSSEDTANKFYEDTIALSKALNVIKRVSSLNRESALHDWSDFKPIENIVRSGSENSKESSIRTFNTAGYIEIFDGTFAKQLLEIRKELDLKMILVSQSVSDSNLTLENTIDITANTPEFKGIVTDSDDEQQKAKIEDIPIIIDKKEVKHKQSVRNSILDSILEKSISILMTKSVEDIIDFNNIPFSLIWYIYKQQKKQKYLTRIKSGKMVYPFQMFGETGIKLPLRLSNRTCSQPSISLVDNKCNRSRWKNR